MKYFLFIIASILLDVASCGSRHTEPEDLGVGPNEEVLDNQQSQQIQQGDSI